MFHSVDKQLRVGVQNTLVFRTVQHGHTVHSQPFLNNWNCPFHTTSMYPQKQLKSGVDMLGEINTSGSFIYILDKRTTSCVPVIYLTRTTSNQLTLWNTNSKTVCEHVTFSPLNILRFHHASNHMYPNMAWRCQSSTYQWFYFDAPPSQLQIGVYMMGGTLYIKSRGGTG